MAIWVRVVFGVLGVVIFFSVLDAAIRTFLLPRVASVRLVQYISRLVGFIFKLLASPKRTYKTRDRILSLRPSVLLLTYQTVWLALTLVAFAFGFIATGAPSFVTAFRISDSSLFALGASSGAYQTTLGFFEAVMGLTLLALLIAFIPTLYSAFQRRELSVSRLTVRSGAPATPWGVLEIARSVNSYQLLDELWREWEQWFIDVGETHSTLVILNFYRSPTPEQTWIGCATTVLDAAALFNSAIDLPASATAGICIRSGWLNLRRIADYFHIEYPTDFSGDRSITISREEFETVLDRMERSGVPVIKNHEAAWHDFVGWRVNYDAIVESFHSLFDSPRTDWRDAALLPLVQLSNRRQGSDD
jgi:hypothetical protein